MAKKKKPNPRISPVRIEKQRIIRESILIVCEGLETEPNYFRSLIAHLALQIVEVKIESAHGAPITVVRRAKQVRDERKKLHKLSVRKKELIPVTPFDEIWCVFDHERIVDNPSFHAAVKMAKDNNFFLAISNPSFEVWYLLHFTNSTSPLENANAVLSALKKFVPHYQKSLDILPMLIPLQEQAIKHARSITERYNDVDYPNPSTGVWELVAKLIAQSL